MANYFELSEAIQNRIKEDRESHFINPYAFKDENVIRRDENRDVPKLWRPVFVSDVEKIIHNPYYNRYADKTQVFSGYKNDDISRRALHVQLVARIARNIGRALNLNLDLIEACALGHDIGHTPFGHAGERILNNLYSENTGRLFNHNVHSVRVLDKLVERNVSLQVLDGVLCHNGEIEMKEYRPVKLENFQQFDKRVEECYTDANANKKQVPSTLEGCVMRISDIIAYLGKDRQDAIKIGLIEDHSIFSSDVIGSSNAEIINNMVVNIIENSYGKDYLCMDEEYFDALAKAKAENYKLIYGNPVVDNLYQENIKPMFEQMYSVLLGQAKAKDKNSVFMKHHIEFIKEVNLYSKSFDIGEYLEQDPNELVVDFMASMTDDYFIDLHRYLLPDSKYEVRYKGYF